MAVGVVVADAGAVVPAAVALVAKSLMCGAMRRLAAAAARASPMPRVATNPPMPHVVTALTRRVATNPRLVSGSLTRRVKVVSGSRMPHVVTALTRRVATNPRLVSGSLTRRVKVVSGSRMPHVVTGLTRRVATSPRLVRASPIRPVKVG